MSNQLFTLKNQLHYAGYAEGISFLCLLGIAMPLKYMAGIPEVTMVVGSLHGIFFIWYVSVVCWAKYEKKINYLQTLFSLLASVLPIGTFVADAHIFKKIDEKKIA